MILVSNLNSMDNLEKLAGLVEAVLVARPLMTKENIEKVASFGLLSILDFSDMVVPFELEKLKEKILLWKEKDCLFYITDLGLAEILLEEGLVGRTIYDPKTLITNHLDAEEYARFGFKGLGLSNEITISDTKAIMELTGIEVFLQVFGYRLMFHSRRQLLSLYEEKIGKSFTKENLVLREEKREDYFPIEENERGTYIYRGYMLNLLKEIKNLNMQYAYISDFRMEKDVYFSVLNIFRGYLDNKIGLEEAEASLRQLNLPLADGFSYQDSVYNKEAF